jgi:Tfp pilus assembly protein PilF
MSRSRGPCIAAVALVVALLGAGCSSPGDVHTRDSTVTSKAQHTPTHKAPKGRAEAELRRGIDSYEEAEYELAVREIQSALDRGLRTPADKAKAYKYLAFVACTSGRIESCHAAFRKALAVDPKFDLAPAEAGHPIWGPVFRDARLEVKGRVTKR